MNHTHWFFWQQLLGCIIASLSPVDTDTETTNGQYEKNHGVIVCFVVRFRWEAVGFIDTAADKAVHAKTMRQWSFKDIVQNISLDKLALLLLLGKYFESGCVTTILLRCWMRGTGINKPPPDVTKLGLFWLKLFFFWITISKVHSCVSRLIGAGLSVKWNGRS